MNARVAKKINGDPVGSGRYSQGQRLKAARICRRRQFRPYGGLDKAACLLRRRLAQRRASPQ